MSNLRPKYLQFELVMLECHKSVFIAFIITYLRFSMKLNDVTKKNLHNNQLSLAKINENLY